MAAKICKKPAQRCPRAGVTSEISRWRGGRRALTSVPQTLVVSVYLLLLGPQLAAGQVLRLTTEKAEFAYGEPIRAKITLTNTRSDTLMVQVVGDGPPCSGAFGFDNQRDWGEICLNVRTVLLAPQARIEWRRVLDPMQTGLPSRSGVHRLRVRFDNPSSDPARAFSLSDSVSVTSPAFWGGTAAVAFRSSDSARVRALRDSLRATVAERAGVGQPSVSEVWRVVGASIDSTVALLQRRDYIELAYPLRRLIHEPERVFTGIETPIPGRSGVLGLPYPNPFASHTTVMFTPGTTGPLLAEIVDVAGRRIALLFEGDARVGEPLKFDLSDGLLAAGTYVIRVSTSDGVIARPISRTYR